ncbi:hypothetical protein Tco_0940239 [Tanacetum coccineum]|uniref:Uncharacterized protein n=1 Tax=Tanacetum coccineum TaxID=301880 RepID=A0ABQ5DU68_9ASTR
MTLRGKKKSAPLLIPSIRFTKLIIHHLKTKHNIHPRTGSPLHYSHDDNVLGNLRFVGKDGREVFEHGKAEEGTVPEPPAGDKASKHKSTSSQPPKPKPAPTKPSKAVLEKKRKLVKETPDEPSPANKSKAGLVGKRCKPKSPLKLVDEFTDEGVPISEPRIDDEEADYQRDVELSLKDLEVKNQGPARTMVIQEPVFGRFQPLPEVQGKGKEKVIEEQAACDLLTLQTPKKKSLADQYIFQRCTPTTTEPSRNAESPSLDAELALADSETESFKNPNKSDKEVTPVNKKKYASNRELIEINAGVQDEGQARSDPGKQDKGQAGSNLENLKLLTKDQGILEEPASSTRTLSSLQNLEKELDFTDQFSMEKPQEEEPEKTNAESEVQSMVTIPIHQDTSSVPPMTTPVIDLTKSQSDSPTVHAPLLTSTTTTTTVTTTTTLPPPPPQQQQSTIDSILLQRIGELEQHMENLIQDNLRSKSHNLENLNIPQKVSKAVDEIFTDSVD